jgi:hypothetical protein
MPAPALLDSISLEPSPVVEAYKKGVDRTLIQQNLMLSVEQRVTKMLSALRLAEEIRRSRPVQR